MKRSFVVMGLCLVLVSAYWASGVIQRWRIKREFDSTLVARSSFVNVQMKRNGPSAISGWTELPASDCKLAPAGCRAFVFRYNGNEPLAWGTLTAVYFPRTTDHNGDFQSGFLWAQPEMERADASTSLRMTQDNRWRYLEFDDALHLQ